MLMGASKKMFLEFSKNLSDQVASNKIYSCESAFTNCFLCKSELLYNSNIATNCVIFTLNGPKSGIIRSKTCNYCKITYNTDHYVKNNKHFSYEYSDLSLIVTSSQSGFEVSLLKDFDKHLVRNAVTFSGYCDAYNKDRELVLNRNLYIKRLEEAWFSYKFKKWVFRSSHLHNLNEVAFINAKEINEKLELQFPKFQECFIKHWSSKHELFCKVHKLCNSFRK